MDNWTKRLITYYSVAFIGVAAVATLAPKVKDIHAKLQALPKPVQRIFTNDLNGDNVNDMIITDQYGYKSPLYGHVLESSYTDPVTGRFHSAKVEYLDADWMRLKDSEKNTDFADIERKLNE